MRHMKRKEKHTYMHTCILPRDKANQQPVTDMAKILQLFGRVFKITVINMLKILMGNMNTIHN